MHPWAKCQVSCKMHIITIKTCHCANAHKIHISQFFCKNCWLLPLTVWRKLNRNSSLTVNNTFCINSHCKYTSACTNKITLYKQINSLALATALQVSMLISLIKISIIAKLFFTTSMSFATNLTQTPFPKPFSVINTPNHTPQKRKTDWFREL